MTIAVVDGDIVAYSCGFAAEATSYETSDGLIHATLTQAKEHCDKEGLKPESITHITETEPLSHALRLVSNLIDKIQRATSAEAVKVFFSDEKNFRDKIATIKSYKGNRTGKKPLHFDKIVKYIHSKYDTKFPFPHMRDIEADDKMGVYSSTYSDIVICTIDKDLDMIPGWHYNWRKDKLYETTEEESLKIFYTQLLTGDPVDNIQGIPGVGKKKAEAILRGITDEELMYELVLCAYSKVFDKPMPVLLENANLLWILRSTETWSPVW
jgi:5'-3' exonuclease